MGRPVVIVGCGGHGREVLGIVRADVYAGWDVAGFVDDDPSDVNLDRVKQLDVPYLGPVSWLADAPSGTYYVLGIGDPRVRQSVGARVDRYRLPAARLVHPDATVGADASLAEGVVVFAGARVTTNVRLGRHVHLNQNATVGHDSALEEYVSVYPLAAVSGECYLEAGALVGTTACVLPGLRVGAGAVVGAGACVVHDVPAGVVVKGVPAR